MDAYFCVYFSQPSYETNDRRNFKVEERVKKEKAYSHSISLSSTLNRISKLVWQGRTTTPTTSITITTTTTNRTLFTGNPFLAIFYRQKSISGCWLRSWTLPLEVSLSLEMEQSEPQGLRLGLDATIPYKRQSFFFIRTTKNLNDKKNILSYNVDTLYSLLF